MKKTCFLLLTMINIINTRPFNRSAIDIRWEEVIALYLASEPDEERMELFTPSSEHIDANNAQLLRSPTPHSEQHANTRHGEDEKPRSPTPYLEPYNEKYTIFIPTRNSTPSEKEPFQTNFFANLPRLTNLKKKKLQVDTWIERAFNPKHIEKLRALKKRLSYMPPQIHLTTQQTLWNQWMYQSKTKPLWKP